MSNGSFRFDVQRLRSGPALQAATLSGRPLFVSSVVASRFLARPFPSPHPAAYGFHCLPLLCVLFCSLLRLASRLRQQASGRYAPSGLSLPLRFARGPLPLTEPRSATPPGGLPPSGAFAHRVARFHFFVSKTCSFAHEVARFHFLASKLALSLAMIRRLCIRICRSLLPTLPPLRQFACNVND